MRGVEILILGMTRLAKDLGIVTETVYNGSDAYKTLFSEGQIPPENSLVIVKGKTGTYFKNYLVCPNGELEYYPTGECDMPRCKFDPKEVLDGKSAPEGWTVFIDSDFQ